MTVAGYALELGTAALVLGVLYAVARLLSRRRPLLGGDRRLVTVVESTMLSPHAAMHVVKVGARYLLIGGGSAGNFSLLTEVAPADIDAWLARRRLNNT